MIDDDHPDDESEDLLPSEQPIDPVPQSRRRQESRIKREVREADAFWRGVFADPVGRREMWKLLDQLHPFEERFACGPNGFPQPEATWFHAGEQSFGNRLHQSWIRIDRAGVFLMHDEHDPRFVTAAPRQKGAD